MFVKTLYEIVIRHRWFYVIREFFHHWKTVTQD